MLVSVSGWPAPTFFRKSLSHRWAALLPPPVDLDACMLSQGSPCLSGPKFRCNRAVDRLFHNNTSHFLDFWDGFVAENEK